MATTRAYTVREIDTMRRSVDLLLKPTFSGRPYDPVAHENTVELRLRTYLEAGVSPDDLLAEASRKVEQAQRDRRPDKRIGRIEDDPYRDDPDVP